MKIEEAQAKIEELQATLKERDDQVTKLTIEVKQLKAQIDGRKYVDLSEQVPFVAKWKTPDGKTATRKVIFKNPKVRLPDGSASVVSAVALTKVAAGKTLTDQEQKENPALAKFTQEAAANLLTKWAQLNAGVLEDAE